MNNQESDIQNNPQYHLSDKEEKELFNQIKEGKDAALRLKQDSLTENERNELMSQVSKAAEAKNRIFLAHIKLIDDVKYKYCYNPMYWLEDVRQDVAFKLMECIDKYDSENGAAFTTYAERCISSSVIDIMATQTSLIINKKNRIKNLWKMKQFLSDFYMLNGKEAEIKDIMEYMGVGEKAASNMMKYDYSVVSYDAPAGISDEGTEFDHDSRIVCQSNDTSGDTIDRMTDQNLFNTTDALVPGSVLYEEVQMQLADIMEKYCTKTEQMILDYRFGFYGDAMTDMQISEKLGMTEEQVEQIWAEALLKLEEPCRKLGLDQILD